MFFRCTSRHKLMFLAVLVVVLTINTFTLLRNSKEHKLRAAAGPRARLMAASPSQRPAQPAAARPTAPVKRPAPAVLIVSYEGAGGSAVSHLLNLAPGVSHHHHPLAPLDEDGVHNGIEPLAPAALSAGLKVLDDTLRCNFSAHAHLLQPDGLWRQHALRTVFLRQCVPENITVAGCMERVCRAADTVSAHVIRPMVADLSPLLSRWRPKLRLLIVQRDPRAILASRRRRHVGLPLVTVDDWRHAARALCSRMLHDVEASDREEALQPGLRKVILFEHLMENPLEVARLLYEFLNINMTSTQLRSILGQAALEPRRATAWKSEVTEPLVRAVDRGCAHFYDASMYSAVAESADLGPDIPLHGGLPEPGSDVI